MENKRLDQIAALERSLEEKMHQLKLKYEESEQVLIQKNLLTLRERLDLVLDRVIDEV